MQKNNKIPSGKKLRNVSNVFFYPSLCKLFLEDVIFYREIIDIVHITISFLYDRTWFTFAFTQFVVFFFQCEMLSNQNSTYHVWSHKSFFPEKRYNNKTTKRKRKKIFFCFFLNNATCHIIVGGREVVYFFELITCFW